MPYSFSLASPIHILHVLFLVVVFVSVIASSSVLIDVVVIAFVRVFVCCAVLH